MKQSHGSVASGQIRVPVPDLNVHWHGSCFDSVSNDNAGGDPMSRTTRRRVLAGSAALASAGALFRPARAATKITFLSSWFAQAEHGGFYQAKASGLYEKAGLDVTIKMGGPQVNGMQLLLAGETDLMMGYDLQVLKSLEQGLPVMTVGT